MQIDLFVLAVLSAFWPTLLVIDILAFQAPRPERILLAFLAGGFLTTVTLGTLIVAFLEGTAFGAKSQTSATDAVLYYVLAGLAFLCAVILARRPRPPDKPPSTGPRGKPDLMTRVMEHGAPLAFVGGIILNIVPGVFPLIALKDITELDYSTAEVVATLFVFYLIMFVLIEAPLVGYLFASDWTSAAVTRFNAWLKANRRRIIVWALVAGGCYLTGRGIYATVT